MPNRVAGVQNAVKENPPPPARNEDYLDHLDTLCPKIPTANDGPASPDFFLGGGVNIILNVAPHGHRSLFNIPGTTPDYPTAGHNPHALGHPHPLSLPSNTCFRRTMYRWNVLWITAFPLM